MGANPVSYETLLRKTNQDDLLKNWGLTLSIYLDDFMTHLQDRNDHTNFSEAAVLLQNSTTFYCKRVDVVHKIIQELVVDFCNNRASDETEDSKKQGPTGRKKNAAKSLEMDGLQLLDFVASERSIDVPLEKITKSVHKQILLCTSMKSLRKGKTSIIVYQSTGNILGCKEEFRIYGKLYFDGTINDDFNDNCERVIERVEECQEENDHDDIRDDSMCMDIDEMIPDANPPESHPELSTHIPEKSILPNSPTLPITQKYPIVPSKARNRRKFEWEPIPHEFKMFLKPCKVISRSEVPKKLDSDDTIKESERLDRGRKRKRRRNGDDQDLIQLMWIDIGVRDKSANNCQIALEIESRKALWKSHIQKTQHGAFVEPDDAMGAVDDDEPDDFEALVDDYDVALRSAPLNTVDNLFEETPNIYVEDALKAVEAFKVNRRENAWKATELAKKVAAWHESIMPLLEIAEFRSKFDVHEYGSQILQKFSDDDHETFRSFDELVVDQPKNEISRYFLLTLMLANTYNLEIRQTDPLVKDCLALRLITKVRHHEEMDEALRVASEDCGT